MTGMQISGYTTNRCAEGKAGLLSKKGGTRGWRTKGRET